MEITAFAPTQVSCPRKLKEVEPSNTADLPDVAKALIVLSAGTLSILPYENGDNEPINFEYLAAGQVVPVVVRRVRQTGTTAIVAACYE